MHCASVVQAPLQPDGGITVGVAVGIGVTDGVTPGGNVGDGVGELVGDGVAVGVGVLVGTGVCVGVGVLVGVTPGGSVGDGVGELVGEHTQVLSLVQSGFLHRFSVPTVAHSCPVKQSAFVSQILLHAGWAIRNVSVHAAVAALEFFGAVIVCLLLNCWLVMNVRAPRPRVISNTASKYQYFFSNFIYYFQIPALQTLLLLHDPPT